MTVTITSDRNKQIKGVGELTFHPRSTNFVNGGANDRVGDAGSESSLSGRSLAKIGAENIPKEDLLHKGRIHICSLKST